MDQQNIEPSAKHETFVFNGQPIRSTTIDGEPWFFASDIAKTLGYRDAHNTIRGLDDDERGTHNLSTPGGTQNVTIINESGLYSAILRSRVPGAKEFKRWVTHEVLPTIRKTGQYDHQQAQVFELPQTYSEALRSLAREVEAREAMESYARELEPKSEAYEAFLSGDGSYSMGNVAKMLGLSQNKLYAQLRATGVIIGKGAMRNTPYQRYMHHFTVKAYDFTRHDGTVGTSYTTRVLPAGVDFIRRRLGLTQQLEVAS